jgi:hypothetical protein
LISLRIQRVEIRREFPAIGQTVGCQLLMVVSVILVPLLLPL